MKGVARLAIHISLLTLCSFSAAQTRAEQTPFDGTWRVLIGQSHFSPKPMVTFLSEGWFHCQSCNPRLDVRADGSDQPVVGQAYDTVSVREIDAKTVELKFKKAGKVVMVDTHAVSRDGRKL